MDEVILRIIAGSQNPILKYLSIFSYTSAILNALLFLSKVIYSVLLSMSRSRKRQQDTRLVISTINVSVLQIISVDTNLPAHNQFSF